MHYKPSDRGYGISRFRNLGVLFDKHANHTEFFAGYNSIVLSRLVRPAEVINQ